MFYYILFKILNNATFAGIFTVILGAFFAGRIYKKQKNIDREYKNEEKIAESLMILEEHCRAVNQVIDRLSNTYKLIIEENNQERIQNFKNNLSNEIGIMADVLMYKIPEDLGKINSIFSLYYSNNKSVVRFYEKFGEELKKWHNFVQLHAIGKSGQKFDLNKRVADIPELSLDKLDESIKKFILNLKNK